MKYHFKILKRDMVALYDHLYPGDNKEAVALIICGRNNENNTFLAHKIVLIPHAMCTREQNYINWPTNLLNDILPDLVRKDLALFKIHSHPSGHNQFSDVDDKSDLELFDSVYGWFDSSKPHGSLIMLPNKELIGRIISDKLEFFEVKKFTIVDYSLTIQQKSIATCENELDLRNKQTLGPRTTSLLKQMSIGIVGCSGTGSPVIEQLSRLGVGKLVLIDPDVVEKKNLNRIVNTTLADTEEKQYKVDVAKRMIEKIGFKTEVIEFKSNIYYDGKAIKALASCDFIFGCMDSVDGRHLLNCISSFYLIPYIDIGIKIISDKQGGVDQICGTIHYIKPDGSSLQTRGVYTHEDLRAANLFRIDPEEYRNQKEVGYIKGVVVEAPAVISINMLASSLAINEFLSRIHTIKVEDLADYDIIRFSLTDYYLIHEKSEHEIDPFLSKYIGRGDMKPLLNNPELSNYGGLH